MNVQIWALGFTRDTNVVAESQADLGGEESRNKLLGERKGGTREIQPAEENTQASQDKERLGVKARAGKAWLTPVSLLRTKLRPKPARSLIQIR